MTDQPAVSIAGLSHAYGKHEALREVTFDIQRREIFAVLGPNGGGKTTLFRLLSTLLPIQSGTANVFGLDLSRSQQQVRERMGVVFQAPSVDKKLTVEENIAHQAALYGWVGQSTKSDWNTTWSCWD